MKERAKKVLDDYQRVCDEIDDARLLASELSLRDSYLLHKYSYDEIIEICNGIGPEWFPARLRKAVDAFHSSTRLAAAIHDLHYYDGTGTDEDFKNANDSFVYNGFRLANHYYRWYDPKRYLARHSVKRFGRLLAAFGRVAYDRAIEEHREAER